MHAVGRRGGARRRSSSLGPRAARSRELSAAIAVSPAAADNTDICCSLNVPMLSHGPRPPRASPSAVSLCTIRLRAVARAVCCAVPSPRPRRCSPPPRLERPCSCLTSRAIYDGAQCHATSGVRGRSACGKGGRTRAPRKAARTQGSKRSRSLSGALGKRQPNTSIATELHLCRSATGVLGTV